MSCPENEPKFLKESEPLVALASFPGSGNTWSRIILETVTGIYTVSVSGTMMHYKGYILCPSTAKILIVKTHEMSILAGRGRCATNIAFSRAIFILRNPYDATLAEYNRRKRGKVKFADRIDFTKPSWISFVKEMSERWKRLALYWLAEINIPVHVLVYEELKANTMLEVYRMMNFLNFNMTFENMYCLVNRSFDRYYRANKPSWLTKTKLYNNNMKELVNSKIKSVYLNVVNSWRNAEILNSYILEDAT